ncbi:MAG: hypothetical protein ABJG68_09765 [Crocinitomicaceae bacterium]
MNQDQLNIDGLFEQARSTETRVSYEETEKRFLKATLLAAGGVLATKGVLKLLSTKKWLIMFSAITTISTASIIGVAAYTGDVNTNETTSNDNFINAEVLVPTPKEENNLSTKTIVFTESVQEQNKDVSRVEQPQIKLIDPLTIALPEPMFTVSVPMWDDSVTVSTSDEKIRAYSERFEINAETSMEDLEAMKEAAENAGISLNYNAKIKNNKLIKISIHAEIKQRNNQQNMTITADDIQKDKEEIIFGWFLDKSGKANEMGFGEPMNSTGCCSGHKSKCHDNYEDQFDEGFFSPRIYEFLESSDTLNEETVEHFEQLIEEMEEELAYLEDDLLVKLEDINLTKIDNVLAKIDEQNAELFNDLEEELNLLFEEIQNEIRDEKEAIEFEKSKMKEEKEKEKNK